MALLQQSPSSSSSSSSFSYGFTYDVFLSFRGTDTRYGFTGNLCNALDGRGIRTFIDDRELHGGDEITPSLLKAIEDSRIFIPVFSINYASSSFCLDELVHIAECSKAKGRLVLPIFYGVDPSHVRHQTGSYGKAIAYHEQRFQNNKESYRHNMERLQKWKMALYQVANLSGYHFEIGNEYEHKFIGNIVKYVSNKISRVPLHVAEHPVGLESRVLHVKSLLDERSDDGVHIIGICGTGGVGKTTLAKAIYNFIVDQFECLCFLHNVRENSAKHDLKHLQEMLLFKTVGLDIKLGGVSEGIPNIKQRLHRKKVLLILDDVAKLEQLQDLAGGRDWFGLGSKVIITTRDKHLLASHGIERTYEVDGLTGEEALELLRWKAFKSDKVDPCYEDILKRAVTYASGLPLALEVVGSDLFGKPIEHWKSALNLYEKIPNKKIQEILKVSFDALDEYALDEYGQSVFLDIACCFKGHRWAEIEDILHAHYGDNMKYHIGVLVEKSLIKIDKWERSYTNDDHVTYTIDDHVTLHDLIEDLGKEIVRQESLIEPGKRSRLWFGEDIVHVLQENTGTGEIEIIYLDFPSIEVVDWNRKAFKKMKNLKTLVIESGHFSEGPTHFPSSLRVLLWKKYPSQCLPSNFHPEKLAICNLSNCRFTSFELTSSLDKKFVNLKILNFDNCDDLIHIPDVSGIPNLEEFSFENCWNLLTIHDSVGLLNKLKSLNAWGCRKLTSFPSIKLTSLQELQLSHCKRLMSFPEILAEMQNLTHISLFGTSIEELPFSFQNLTGLDSLTIQGNGMLKLSSSILMMPNLSFFIVKGYRLSLPKENDKLSSIVFSNIQTLVLKKCNLADEFLPIVLTWFANVISLDLSENNFTILPGCIKECHYLRALNLDDCKHLREIGGIPPNLKYLTALGCKSLTSGCRSILLNQQLHEAGCTKFRLPVGNERIPEWFEHQCRGPSISFWFRNRVPSVALLVAIKSMHNKCSKVEDLELRVRINGYECTLIDFGLVLKIRPDHTYLSHPQLDDWVRTYGECSPMWGLKFIYELSILLFKNEWIHVEVMLTGSVMESVLIETGMHVLKKESSMEDIQFTNPYEEKRKLDEVWVKLNCDVVVPHRSNAAACGGILRDHFGLFLGGFTGQLGEIPILHAELKAILYGVQFAWTRGYRKVIIKSDCPYAIELLRKERPPADVSCWNLVREIHSFSNSASEVVWSHTSGERNWEANGFAKHGLELSCNRGLVIFDDVPSFIIEIWLDNDFPLDNLLLNDYSRCDSDIYFVDAAITIFPPADFMDAAIKFLSQNACCSMELRAGRTSILYL